MANENDELVSLLEDHDRWVSVKNCDHNLQFAWSMHLGVCHFQCTCIYTLTVLKIAVTFLKPKNLFGS